MKLRTKLVLGFAAVILVMVALGATAFVMFKRVDSNIAAVNRDSLPVVRYSTGVERSVLESILEEKNYLLFKTPEIYARAKAKLNQLASNLDEIDKLGQDFRGDPASAKTRFDEDPDLSEGPVDDRPQVTLRVPPSPSAPWTVVVIDCSVPI